jgi:hypothetical protein
MPKKRRSTSTLSQKLFKEVQVNDQICTNLKFQKRQEFISELCVIIENSTEISNVQNLYEQNACN